MTRTCADCRSTLDTSLNAIKCVFTSNVNKTDVSQIVTEIIKMPFIETMSNAAITVLSIAATQLADLRTSDKALIDELKNAQKQDRYFSSYSRNLFSITKIIQVQVRMNFFENFLFQ